MSARVTWSVKLNERERATKDAALDQCSAEQGFKGRSAQRQALIHVLEKSLLGFPTTATPSSIQHLRDAIGCDLLEHIDGVYYCLEEMGRPIKKPRELSESSVITRMLCEGCQKAKQKKREEFDRNEDRKEAIRRLRIFRTMLIKVGRQGFESAVYLCTCTTEQNNAVFLSRDGVTLPCPLQEFKPVNIDKVCRMVVDPKRHRPPCGFLVEEHHTVKPDFKAEEKAVEAELLQLENKTREVVET